MNDPPQITTLQPPAGVYQDQYYFASLEAIDTDPGATPLTWSIDTNAEWLELNATTGVLSGIPTDEAVGSFWVNVSVTDDGGAADSLNFTITVLDVNDPPQISSAAPQNENATATQDQPYSYVFTATDLDEGDMLDWSLASSTAAWLTLNTTTGELSGTPSNADVGTHRVEVTVTDGEGASDTIAFTITVLDVNDPPQITTTSLPQGLTQNPYHTVLTAVDPDRGETLKWSLAATNASWLMLDENGLLHGTPTIPGTYFAEVVVNDGSATAMSNLTIIIEGDMDGDGVPDALDPDIDGDGVPNELDAFPLDASEWADIDDDGIGDNADTDTDGDGWNDTIELALNTDPLDATDHPLDTDGDGVPDALDPDIDGDGYPNHLDAFPLDASEWRDTDGDGVGDNADDDDDNDGWNDTIEDRIGTDPTNALSAPTDLDGDGVPDALDPDIDGDGVPNELDAFPLDAAASLDVDGDGYPDSWNEGKDASDSTSDLTKDAYPGDKQRWAEEEPVEERFSSAERFIWIIIIVVLVIVLLIVYMRKREEEEPAPAQHPRDTEPALGFDDEDLAVAEEPEPELEPETGPATEPEPELLPSLEEEILAPEEMEDLEEAEELDMMGADEAHEAEDARSDDTSAEIEEAPASLEEDEALDIGDEEIVFDDDAFEFEFDEN